jgi:hypothetical protein
MIGRDQSKLTLLVRRSYYAEIGPTNHPSAAST